MHKKKNKNAKKPFKWKHFAGEIILWLVRWYCRYVVPREWSQITRNYKSDESSPFENGVQAQVSNHLKQLRLKILVVSVKEKLQMISGTYGLKR